MKGYKWYTRNKEYICQECGKRFMNYIGDKTKFCSRDCFYKSIKGEGGSNWQGGRFIRRGYVMIYHPNHPVKSLGKKSYMKNYVEEHRLVMEKYLGRYLQSNEKVHHINSIQDDNRIENLKLYSNHSKHMSECHRKIRKGKILSCKYCGKKVYVYPSILGRFKFCSRKCHGFYRYYTIGSSLKNAPKN